MEADWEVEIGPDAPIIDGSWPGIVDLEQDPGRIREITEAAQFQPLANALLLLNAPTLSAQIGSPIRTLKCDLWFTADLDPDEMEATDASCGLACYIDLVPWPGPSFTSLAAAEQWARRIVALLRDIQCPSGRVDLVIRRAFTLDNEGLGITAYLSACGATPENARQSLAGTLQAFSNTVIAPAVR